MEVTSRPMGRKKGKIIEKVSIEGMADDGRCIAHHEGMALFVSEVAPGDVVDVQISRPRKNFAYGRPVHFHSRSGLRVTPQCDHFGVCGGCKWQHVSYETQLQAKEKIVRDSLERIGKVELPKIEPILGSQNTYEYRNKLEFTFSNKRWLLTEELDSGEILERNALGFHIPKLYDKIVDIETCHLQRSPTNEIKNTLRKYALENRLSFYDIREKKGLLRNLIIRTTTTGEVMVIVQFGAEDEVIESVMQYLADEFPGITSLQYVINTKMNETFQDLEVITYKGRDHIIERMSAYRHIGNDLQFRIGPKSFFQTNSLQAEKLYNIALDFCDLKGHETLYDLYCGAGTISLYASSQVSKAVGIEYVKEAIEDAGKNAALNKVDKVEFTAGDMKDVLTKEFVQSNGVPDVIITDPPRAGMHESVVKRIEEISAPKVVYISCNPATQARDLALLDQSYSVTKVQPVDMFPHTSHIENVVLLESRK